jgi:hypothetical protein
MGASLCASHPLVLVLPTSLSEIENDAITVLGFALERQNEARRLGVDQVSEDLSGPEIEEGTRLPPARINDAVALLRLNDYLEGLDWFGTAPYDFGQIRVTPLGRFEHQRAKASAPVREGADRMAGRGLDRLPLPIGSPYGFTDQDWEYVTRERSKSDQVKVVLGYQFKSDWYDSDALVRNLTGHLELALATYNDKWHNDPRIQLVFKPLSAGYGEHLFNDIAREIISSDVAIFETSDANENVMIEMGVALTWGTRVLPIKQQGRVKPPSDISGQTWVDYRDSAIELMEHDFREKLLSLVERAHQRKSSTQ